MALEPITRQEKIIAGQDLTPITRMEKFLKQYGGGSGGVTSWNDLTDKPFGEVTTVKEVLAETTCETIGGEGGVNGFGYVGDVSVAAGNTYIVNWNGAEYTCVASVNDVGGEGFFLGNMAVVGEGNDTGEPFLLIIIPGTGMEFYGSDGSTSVTISIRQEVTEVKKISGKYVEGMGYVEKSFKEVLAECQPEFNADARSFTLANPIGLVAGEKYIVRWNGVDYRCEAGTVETEFPTGAATLVCIGNLGSSGFGEDTGEPFCVADGYPPEAQAMVGFGCAISSFDGSTTLTLSIRQESETIHPIDQKFLLSGGGGRFVVNLMPNDDYAEYKADKTFAEVVAAYDNGQVVDAVTVDGGEAGRYIAIYRLFTIDTHENKIVFSGTGMMFDEWYIYKATMDADGNVVITNKQVT